MTEKLNELITVSEPRSPISEAYRTLRTNLDFASLDQALKTIVVTSAGVGEGKSTVAANLALAFATDSTRAAIVNLDLRRPTFNVIFSRRMDKGITDYIIGDSSLDEIMVKENGRSVTIVPSGTIPPNPSELVASKKVQQELEVMKAILSSTLGIVDPIAKTIVALGGGETGVILLITLVILVILSTLGYTLCVQVAARRHRAYWQDCDMLLQGRLT
jgi:capsular exopolysaccharide synthesis family protein